MTEADWLSTDAAPKAMLTYVRRRTSGRALRLVAVAGCRLVQEFADPDTRAGIDYLERIAVGECDDPMAIVRDLIRSHRERDPLMPAGVEYQVAQAFRAAAHDDPRDGVERAFDWILVATKTVDISRAVVNQQLCDVVREIVGNPFRRWDNYPDFLGGRQDQPDGRAVHFSEIAVSLARGIVADRAFDRLPMLADAVEESGATDAELLGHLRRSDGHRVGCWAVERVQGR